ncbi:MAG: R-phenyllactate dehydratase small subunit [bacterium]|nr:MAG: R-phenyllactate dehydratase small subunit [bacterium]
MKDLNELVNDCKHHAFDLNFTRAKKWKEEKEGRVLVGYMPIYFPREILHAAGAMPVGIFGGGDHKQIIKGDAYYQSYICRIPRGIVELALDGHFNNFDGFIFPAICDVIRNLSGMFLILKQGKFVKYLDYPQNFQPGIGGLFYKNELLQVLNQVKQINNVEVSPERLNNSIKLYNKNRNLIEKIYDIKQEFPWRLTAEELYYIVRAGMVIPVEEHNKILEDVIDFISENIGEPMDKIKIIVSGSFCEQPPVSLIKTIELAGCYIVDDDFMLGSRWIQGNVETGTDDPINSLVEAYLTKSTFSSSVYDVGNPKEERLIELFNRRKADGIIFAAPSFCDPALLDAPVLHNACDDKKIRYMSFKYSENTGQFKNIKEQVGAFADSIKLWSEELIDN